MNQRATVKQAAGEGSVALILQILCAVLLFVLILLFVDIARQYRIMEDGVRENALWSVYQLDREVSTLEDSLADLRVQPASAKLHDELALRYDILYSRVDIVEQGKFGSYFADDQQIRGLIVSQTFPWPYGTRVKLAADYAKLMKDSPRYAPVLASAGSAQDFARGLQRAGYATDPAYADKLTRTINTTLRLQRTIA